MDSDLLHPPRVGLEDLEFEAAVVATQLTTDRTATEHGEDETAERVGILLAPGRQKAAVDQGFHLLDRGAGIGNEHAVASLAELGFRIVMLVGDVADDLLDEILDADQTVSPAIFTVTARSSGRSTMPWLAASSGFLGRRPRRGRAKLFSVIQRMKSLMWTMPEGSSSVSR
jgi:hypothetical protein